MHLLPRNMSMLKTHQKRLGSAQGTAEASTLMRSIPKEVEVERVSLVFSFQLTEISKVLFFEKRGSEREREVVLFDQHACEAIVDAVEVERRGLEGGILRESA